MVRERITETTPLLRALPHPADARLGRLGRPVQGRRRPRPGHAPVPGPGRDPAPRRQGACSAISWSPTCCTRVDPPASTRHASGGDPHRRARRTPAPGGGPARPGSPDPCRPTRPPVRTSARRAPPGCAAGSADRTGSTCRAELSVMEGRDRQAIAAGRLYGHVRARCSTRSTRCAHEPPRAKAIGKQHEEPHRLEVEQREADRRDDDAVQIGYRTLLERAEQQPRNAISSTMGAPNPASSANSSKGNGFALSMVSNALTAEDSIPCPLTSCWSGDHRAGAQPQTPPRPRRSGTSHGQAQPKVADRPVTLRPGRHHRPAGQADPRQRDQGHRAPRAYVDASVPSTRGSTPPREREEEPRDAAMKQSPSPPASVVRRRWGERRRSADGTPSMRQSA